MKSKDLILRCYIKMAEGQFVAVCIDLCLAAQADTAKQARTMLVSQIESYVEEALTVDREFADDLLNRKAPLYQRIEYALIVAASKIHLAKSGITQAFKTILPVHVGRNCDA
jgi:hypothetical protein